MAEQLIVIPWSDELQEVMTALAKEPESVRNTHPAHLVARQLLVVLKLGDIPPFERVIQYTKLKEPAANNFTDAVLRSALNDVIDALKSSTPMNVMQL